MKNKIMCSIYLFVVCLLALSPLASGNDEQYGMMGGYSMMGGMEWFGMSLLGLVYLVIAAFTVSVIFWLTYRWIAK